VESPIAHDGIEAVISQGEHASCSVRILPPRVQTTSPVSPAHACLSSYFHLAGKTKHLSRGAHARNFTAQIVQIKDVRSKRAKHAPLQPSQDVNWGLGMGGFTNGARQKSSRASQTGPTFPALKTFVRTPKMPKGSIVAV